jgi:hypothetical protein
MQNNQTDIKVDNVHKTLRNIDIPLFDKAKVARWKKK